MEDKRRVRKKLERLNAFSKDVYVIQAKEGENEGNKRRRLGDGSFTVTAVEIPPVSDNSCEVGRHIADPAGLPAGSSRVSASADSADVLDNPLKSTLLPLDVMDRYLERAKKLRAELKNRFILSHFDDNVNLFRRSWRVEQPLPEHMRTNALQELGVKDLAILRTLLRSGWPDELQVCRGDGSMTNSHIWVTPATRT